MKLLNCLELINEVSILIVVYHLIAFTDYVGSRETQYKVGWSLCAFTALNILTNLIFLVVTQTRALYVANRNNLRKCFAKCSSKRKKQTQEIQDKDKQNSMLELHSEKPPDDEESDASSLVREVPSARSLEIAEKIMSQTHEEMISRLNDSSDHLAQSTRGGKYDSDGEVVDLEMQSVHTETIESGRKFNPSKTYQASSFKPKMQAKNRQLVRDLQLVALNNLKE